MLKRINDALPGLVVGIILYGIVIQLTGVWLVEDKLRYSTGLWAGIIMGVGLAIHLAIVIRDTVEMGGDTKHANGRVIAKSLMRYGIVVILFFILGYFHLGNLITAFLGVMGLKVSAYLQPVGMKLAGKLWGRNDAASPEQ